MTSSFSSAFSFLVTFRCCSASISLALMATCSFTTALGSTRSCFLRQSIQYLSQTWTKGAPSESIGDVHPKLKGSWPEHGLKIACSSELSRMSNSVSIGFVKR